MTLFSPASLKLSPSEETQTVDSEHSTGFQSKVNPDMIAIWHRQYVDDVVTSQMQWHSINVSSHDSDTTKPWDHCGFFGHRSSMKYDWCFFLTFNYVCCFVTSLVKIILQWPIPSQVAQCLLQNWTILRSTQTTAPNVNHYSVNHIVDQKWSFSLVYFQASAHLQSRGVQSFVASPISWSFVSFAPNAYFLKSVTSISAFLNFDMNHQQRVCTKFCLEIYNLFSS